MTLTIPILVIIGPSGAGKSSVAQVLCDSYGFQLEKTVTTRPQRDAHDTDHIFVGEETYQHMLESNAFFGTLDVFGHRYGLPRFNPKKPTILLLRAPAIEEFLTMFPSASVIEIDAPPEVLEERLTARGTPDRINPESMTKEIALGRSLAHYSFDSSQMDAAEIARAITRAIDTI